MKKILFLMAMSIISIYSFSQEKVLFRLQQDGTFLSDKSGKKYEIVLFEGVSCDKLYITIKNNINSLFKKPKEVMSEVENTSISIRAYSDAITCDKLPLCAVSVYSGYYNLMFHFKDGKIKVDAPIIDETIYEGLEERNFSYIASGFFKKGNVNPKKEKYKLLTEDQINVMINKILGFGNDTEEDEW